MVHYLNHDLTDAGAESVCFGCQNGAAFVVNSAMSSELTVQSVAAARTTSDAVVEVRAAVQPASAPVRSTAATRMPNPNLRLDPPLGIVVIEFRNDTSGVITTSIPSERQLAEYQRWDVTHFGPTPPVAHSAATTDEAAPAAPLPPASPKAADVKQPTAAPIPSGTPGRQPR
jgi:hypothetical protein